VGQNDSFLARDRHFSLRRWKMRGETLANKSADDRSGTDFYPTPANVTEALLYWLNLPKNTTIWEPACGEGHMTKAIKAKGYHVVSSNLHDQGCGETGVDFTTLSKCECDWIITNPPFKQAEEFINTASKMGVPFAFLLKSQYWHAARRGSVFDKYQPAAVLPLRWRPDFLFGAKAGAPTMEVLWTVWDAAPSDFTEYAPLDRM